MNPIPIFQFIALASFGALALSAATAPVAIAAEPAKAGNTLSVGETQRFAEDFKITFLALKKDTRCPINAKCISAGDAVALLRIKVGNKPAKNYSLHLHGKKDHITLYPNDSPDDPFKLYRIEIARLTPDRVAGETIPQKDYRLKLSMATAIEGPIVN